jgi:hypothetical protein
MVEFLKWAMTNGEQMAAPMNYAPLPANLIKRVLDEIDKIKY